MTDFENKIKSILEGPIPFDELPQSSHYLRSKDKLIMLKRAVDKDVEAIKDMLNNMSWKKITFEISLTTYVPILPNTILTAMKKLFKGTSPGSQSEIAQKFPSEWKSMVKQAALDHFCTDSYSFKGSGMTRSYIYMKIDNGSNRTHFPNGGISQNLRKTGLGKKLYRALIEQKPWVQTNSAGTTAKDWMWASLTHQQFKPNGSRDKDAEIYSFRISDSLYAVSTTRQDNIVAGYNIINDNISDKSKLATKELRIANQLGIDEDFVKLCKANKRTNDKAQLVVSWLAPTAADLRAAKAAERERKKAEEARKKEEQKRLNRLLKDRLKAFCGVTKIEDLSSDWDVGDYIVLKQYLLQADYRDLPVRKVTGKRNGTYYAYKETDTQQNDSRRTDDKTLWVKALPPAVGSDYPPGIMGVDVNARRRGFSSSTDTTTSTPETETETSTLSNYNFQSVFPNEVDAAITNILEFTNPERKRFLRQHGSEDLYILNSDKLGDAYKFNGVPIFGYFINNNNIYNTKTMEKTDDNVGPLSIEIFKENSTKYRRSQLEDKRELNEGDLVFIKMHSKFFGYVAKVMGTALTNRGDKYVYLRVPGAGRNNRLTLTPRALDKLTPVNNESVQPVVVESKKSIPMFEMKVSDNFISYLKQVQELNI